ncbi:AAA family ATPase [Rhodococcus sp. NPDC003348]
MQRRDEPCGGFRDIADVVARFDARDHLLDEGTAAAIYLATELGRPLLLEGEPGVGKTTAAKTLAEALGAELIRLQCYEGLGVAEALYDWNYQRQMLAIRLAQDRAAPPAEPDRTAPPAEPDRTAPPAEPDRTAPLSAQHATAPLSADDLFTEEFLLERPILRCVRHRSGPAPVLLVDEIDRADDEFEALLLEFLGESAVTVPELGTFAARTPPRVVLTSNRSRDLHDALRRRCLYHWIEYPRPERAVAILRRKVPAANTALVGSVVGFVGEVRRLDLDKPPGVAEAIDWVAALAALGAADLAGSDLARADIVASIGALAKTPDDRAAVLALLDGDERGGQGG